jgi:hypothetical protein
MYSFPRELAISENCDPLDGSTTKRKNFSFDDMLQRKPPFVKIRKSWKITAV